MEAKTKVKDFIPANKRMLVKQDVAPKSVMQLPKGMEQNMKPNSGEVISVAKNCDEAKAGDKILFYDKAGLNVNLDGQEFLLIHELEILGYDNA